MNTLTQSNRASLGGFTLLEFMMTLAMASLLAVVAVPNIRDFIRNNRLTGEANDLLRAFQTARGEAIKRQQNIVVCASSDPLAANPSCSYGVFTGWFVFEDTNGNWSHDAAEAVLQTHVGPGTTTVVGDNHGIVSYARTGFANPPGAKTPSTTVVMCDERGNKQIGDSSTARAVLIEQTGRTRVTKKFTDIQTAIGVTGSCP